MKGKKYPFSAYDKYLCLRMSPLMWLTMLFLARPYVIFIISVANRRDRMGILELFHGEPSMGLLGAVAGIPAAILALAWTRRQPDAPAIVQRTCHAGKHLLVLSSLLNIAVILLPYLTGNAARITAVGWSELAVCLLIIAYLAKSQRVKDTFADFPKPSSPASGNTA